LERLVIALAMIHHLRKLFRPPFSGLEGPAFAPWELMLLIEFLELFRLWISPAGRPGSIPLVAAGLVMAAESLELVVMIAMFPCHEHQFCC
jgi:hypothetical protein